MVGEEHDGTELASGVRVGLLEDRLAMVLHRPRRDEQALGDRRRVEVLRDQRCDLAFALTQRERLQA